VLPAMRVFRNTKIGSDLPGLAGAVGGLESSHKADMPRFSLILGTIGRSDDVELLLSSLEAQTWRDFELIVVDQNEDDRLAPILSPHEDTFPVLHFRSKPGLSRAKNLGLEHASGEYIGFPDDDCRYPAGLLQEVARFLKDHPETDGLTIRSIDEFGNETGGKSARNSGIVNKFNVWNRGGAYTMFVRAESVRGIRYDEDMGPGAGTEWGAGDDKDYLLQILDRGGSLFYNRDLAALHPHRTMPYDKALYRAYTYECGAGRAIQKHGFPLWFKVGWLIKPLGGLVLYLLGLRKAPGVGWHWNVFKGRLGGLWLGC
jgi:glycosyltransferase involved in cell wall biosynthesis